MSEIITRIWAQTSLPTSTSDEFPPLTTLFTPDPSCASFYISSDSSDSTYYATAFPEATCLDESGQSTVRLVLKSLLFPPVESPGAINCLNGTPYHATLGPLAGVLSSPTLRDISVLGLTLADGICQKTTSQATLLFTYFDDCAYTETVTVVRVIDGGDGIVISATPIRLTGQRLPTTTPFTSTSSSAAASSPSSTPPSSTAPYLPTVSSSSTASPASATFSKSAHASNPKEMPTNQSPLSQPAMIGTIVGSILGTVLIFVLTAFYIWRRTRARAAAKVQSKQTVKAEPDEHTGKPELEGSKAYVYTTRAELDAAATRAELEGDLRGPYGDGIYVFKPELEGAVGAERHRGAYVMKVELEATSKPGALAARHDTTELEALASRAGVGTSIAARPDVQRR
ncbi:hypothetical protein O1611_g4881 [Lasiodiplodia mahajangana]|uniref:Uncharacterized protein n=1 Tax=Lasiodiplodia mahajangana TaxID=1108764 RepID=A0ACC2JNH9_9PEZI|nr:hypothetical protein O1611_g4881 [Lasiodiplodia mahajangana]